jgi:Ran GTPase-activating protein (RanGAP) involved in mRNA processing and transport
VLKNLKNLDLTGNPVTESKTYRDKMLEIFPGLEVLDCLDKEGNEVLSEGEEDEEYDDEDGYGDEDSLGEGEEDEEELEGEQGFN